MIWPDGFPQQEVRLLLKKITIYPDDGAVEIVKRLNDILQDAINDGTVRKTISISTEEGTAVSFLYLRGSMAAKHNIPADDVRRMKRES